MNSIIHETDPRIPMRMPTGALRIGAILALLFVTVAGAFLLNNRSYQREGKDFGSILEWLINDGNVEAEYASEIAQIEANIAAGESLAWPGADFGPRVWAIQEDETPERWLDHYQKHRPTRIHRSPLISIGGGCLKFMFSWQRCVLHRIDPMEMASGGRSPPFTVWFEPPDFLEDH